MRLTASCAHGLRHYFLSKGRVNTQVLMRDLGTIHLGAAPEHRQPIQDTDIEVKVVADINRMSVQDLGDS